MSPFESIVQELIALHDLKQADYGRDADPFANVRASEEFGIPAWLGSVLRGNDKMSRLKTFAQKGTLKNESVEDSLKDLANYAIIALCLWREKKLADAKADFLDEVNQFSAAFGLQPYVIDGANHAAQEEAIDRRCVATQKHAAAKSPQAKKIAARAKAARKARGVPQQRN